MKEITIEINGKKIKALVEDDVWKEVSQPVAKKTGYEKVKIDERYYYVDYDNEIESYVEDGYDENTSTDEMLYRLANYYSNETVAENNARADKLMRQLRRFAVEHRETELDWVENNCSNKFKILFDHDEEDIRVDSNQYIQLYGAIYFDSEEAAQLAIDTFKDELLWYFTEYKNSL